MLVEDGRIALEDPVERWLPELASRMVVRTPAEPGRRRGPGCPADHGVSTCSRSAPGTASRPTSRCRRSSRCSASEERRPQAQRRPAPDEWMATLSRIPLLHQPGEAWLYNTCSDIQGVLVARVFGQPLPEFLAERLFEPLGMVDTGFAVPAGKLRPLHQLLPGRAAGSSWPTHPTGSGAACRRSRPAPAAWSRRSTTGTPSPACCSPTELSTAAACCRPTSVRQMTTDQLTPPSATRPAVPGGPGLGLRWLGRRRGVDPWNVPAATAGSAAPGRRRTSSRPPARSPSCSASWRWRGPTPPTLMRDFWRCAVDG